MPVKRSQFLLFLLLCVVTIIVRPLYGSNWLAVDPVAVIQYILFFAALLVIGRLRPIGIGMPKPLLWLAAGGALMGAAISFSHVSIHGPTFLVARLAGDDLESSSRIVREELAQRLAPHSQIGVHRHPEQLNTSEEALQVLHAFPNVLGVIWGKNRWITVTLPALEPIELSAFPANSVAQLLLQSTRLPDLKIVVRVPSLGMSLSPVKDSTHFLAEMLPFAIRNPSDFLTQDESDLEAGLASAGTLKATWTSYAHRAYANWILGSYSLIRTLAAGQFEPGRLRCSITNFTEALAFLRWGDAPELRAAILNNLGIAHYILGVFQHDLHEIKRARQIWRGIPRVLHEPNLLKLKLVAPFVAQNNLALVEKAHRHKSHRGPANNRPPRQGKNRAGKKKPKVNKEGKHAPVHNRGTQKHHH